MTIRNVPDLFLPKWMPFSACVFALLLSGCGGDSVKGIPNLTPVTGTVKFEGKPVATGMITFSPVDPKSAGGAVSGKIESGSYRLMTSATDAGALPGDYKVAVVAKQGVDTMDKDGKPVPAKNLVPDKYSSIETSELTATVKKGEKNVVDFDLKP